MKEMKNPFQPDQSVGERKKRPWPGQESDESDVSLDVPPETGGTSGFDSDYVADL